MNFKKKRMLMETNNPGLLYKRDIKAFSHLYEHYAPALYGTILKLTPTASVADTLLEESFQKIWQQMDSYNPSETTIFLWMFRITIQHCSEQLRITQIIVIKKLIPKKILNGFSFEGHPSHITNPANE